MKVDKLIPQICKWCCKYFCVGSAMILFINYYGVTVKIMTTYYNSYYLQLETQRIYEALEVEEIKARLDYSNKLKSLF